MRIKHINSNKYLKVVGNQITLVETVDENSEFLFEDILNEKDHIREFNQFTVFKIRTCYWNKKGEYSYIWMPS